MNPPICCRDKFPFPGRRKYRGIYTHIYLFIDESKFTYAMSKVYISYKYKSIDIMCSVMLTHSWSKYIYTRVNEFKILMKYL